VIELLDTSPQIAVDPAEYHRLLGYPRGAELSERAQELEACTRAWYAAHGRPWIYARQAATVEVADHAVVVDGERLTSPRLRRSLRDAAGTGAVLVAVSAGPELESEAHRRWVEAKPDEYFFLEVYGSAVVEHLTMIAGARLCAWADGERLAVLPHDSPGYPDWDIAEQSRLMALVNARAANGSVPIDVLETGMLRPKKSLLAVFGLTPALDRVERLTSLVPCEHCAYQPCQYRRAPYRRPSGFGDRELAGIAGAAGTDAAAAPPIDLDARYTVNVRALARWTQDRLMLDRHADGSIDATFRYDGTTCTNIGRPIAFDYHVTLGPAAEGFPIRRESCGPAPGDTGHAFMCRYLSHPDELMASIAAERPLVGQRLDDAIGWRRPAASAGCYCEPESRLHKWGLVLETIHYALARTGNTKERS